MREGRRSLGRGAVHSGVLTGISTAVVQGTAAIVGVILARKFGHGVKTDGFFAAYGVYTAVVLIASVVRTTTLPRFVRAAADARLPAETGNWLATLALPLVPLVAVAIAWPHGFAGAITAGASKEHYAAQLLPWVVASAALQVAGGIVAAALAARDDYVAPAVGFAAGSVAGLAVTVALLGHGLIAFGWGLAVNGLVSLGVPLGALVRRGDVGAPDARPWARAVELVEGAALPIALQLFFVIAGKIAAGQGAGAQTTFSYAYLIASFCIALTATSLALVSTVPFARGGAAPERVARHVVATSWLSLAPIAAVAAAFAALGGPVAHHVLGHGYGGGTGAELGRLVLYLAPWMVAQVAITVVYPLVFVRGRARWLPVLALAAVGVQVLVEWLGARLAGLGGIAAGMAVTTGVVALVLLSALGALRRTARGLAAAALTCGGLAALVFGLPALAVGPHLAAAIGLVAYAAVLAVWRPAGLRHAWAYIHSLD
jgi:hypothetical protein